LVQSLYASHSRVLQDLSIKIADDVNDETAKQLPASPRSREDSYTIVANPKVPESTDTVKAVKEPDGERVKDVLPQDAAEANLSAPGVEAEQAVEAEREAKAAAKKKSK
jgi:hypothetical protein